MSESALAYIAALDPGEIPELFDYRFSAPKERFAVSGKLIHAWFAADLSPQQAEDVNVSRLLAQLAADVAVGGPKKIPNNEGKWFDKFSEVLQNVGWTSTKIEFSTFDNSDLKFTNMKELSLHLITLHAPRQYGVAEIALTVFPRPGNDRALDIFNCSSTTDKFASYEILTAV
ncbi:hypothetical protein BDN72DRAFT_904181 [Pluteus cervinus]|uniref:Uncharacterized protein n=1 Tax=Pluteus cervinus TaxID=181527 RepID=A0ACD3A652_9AGAR|nr:hypothetical protein BDN72DRAFT_904181 [Pluteus cervinus]